MGLRSLLRCSALSLFRARAEMVFCNLSICIKAGGRVVILCRLIYGRTAWTLARGWNSLHWQLASKSHSLCPLLVLDKRVTDCNLHLMHASIIDIRNNKRPKLWNKCMMIIINHKTTAQQYYWCVFYAWLSASLHVTLGFVHETCYSVIWITEYVTEYYLLNRCARNVTFIGLQNKYCPQH